MAIDSGTCNVAHYEYRVASGTLGTDIAYTRGRCAAIMIAEDQKVSAVERVMGIQPKPGSYYKIDKCEYNEVIDSVAQIAHDLYMNHDFSAFTEAVSDTHLEENRPVINYRGGNHRYNPDADLKKYRHKYIELKELATMLPYKLNAMYKGMFYEHNDGKKFLSWLNAEEASKKILAYQKELGYTEDAPFGKDGFVLKDLQDVLDMDIIDMRNEYKLIMGELAPKVNITVVNTMTKFALEVAVEEIYAKHAPEQVEEANKKDKDAIVDDVDKEHEDLLTELYGEYHEHMLY